MNDEIISQIYSVKSSTIGDIKGLLHDIKHHKTHSLESRIRELEGELKKIKKSKRYGLVWEDKPEDVVERCKSELPLLKEVASRRITKTDDDLHHILIQWDNYHALSTLAYTHAGKIDVIYIDPPYNTGNEDFRYCDNRIVKEDDYWNFVSIDDPYRHTKWVSFMNRRLKLAKKLLSERWVIFISIDDNEIAQLKLLCDEIIWVDNFIWNFVINSTPNARDYWHIWKMHEYCLFYSKNYLKTETNLIDEVDKKFTYNDEIGGYNIHPLYNSNESFTNENRPNLFYPFYVNPVGNWDDRFHEISIDKKDWWIEVFPPKSVKNGIQFVWRWWKEKSQNNLNLEIIWYAVNDKEFRIVQKMRHSSKLIRSLLSDKNYTSRKWTAEVEKIFWKKLFSFPKSVWLIKHFLKSWSHKNSIILDFFAGSGTTGHAVLELNKEDGGRRQFILCTNNENQIAEEVTYPRIRNVIEGYADVEGIPANLRYYKTEFIEVEKSLDDLRYKFMWLCDELLCIKENTFEEIKLKWSATSFLPLGENWMREAEENWENWWELKLYKNSQKYMAILYDIHHFEECIKLLRTLEKPVKVYVFSLAREIYEEELSYIWNHIEVANIPDDILETYKKIFQF